LFSKAIKQFGPIWVQQDLKPALVAVHVSQRHKNKGNDWNVLPANTGVKVLAPSGALRFATGASLLSTALANFLGKSKKFSSPL